MSLLVAILWTKGNTFCKEIFLRRLKTEKMCDSCLYIVATELDNPALWSKEMVEGAVKRAGGPVCDIEGIRLIVKNYLAILSNTLKQGC